MHPSCAPMMGSDKEKEMGMEHEKREGVTPEEWVKRGSAAIKNAMTCYN